MDGMDESPYPEQITTQFLPPQSDVDEVLRKKRKAREHKACYPCRQRKVKCDLSRPCQTCRDRDHPELCSYHPPTNRQNVGTSAPASRVAETLATSGMVTLSRGEFDLLCRKLNSVESSVSELRRELRRSQGQSGDHDNDVAPGAEGPMGSVESNHNRHASVHGVHITNDLTGETIHLGGGSVPAMAMALGHSNREQPEAQEILGTSILPIFGLDNESALHPFVDLWGLPHGSLGRAQGLSKALPSDAQMLNLFRFYRDMGNVIYPGIADTQQLESDLTLFLINRAAQMGTADGVTVQTIYGKSMRWCGLLFAALASGSQCSSLPRKERELTSQVYVCCSFECLRFTNSLSHASLETIQTLMVLINVITNSMNPGTAWSFIGLTTRLAQGLGLHRACPVSTPVDTKIMRAKIWWSIIWQDSLLSITYDRASSTATMDQHAAPLPQSYGPVGHYYSSMYRLCKVGLDIVRDRALAMNPREIYHRIIEHRDSIQTIMRESAEYLRDSRKCTSLRESLEHWALYLHSSYVLSELCRPAISTSITDAELTKAFKQFCLDNLVNTVEAYLGLLNITIYAGQSWASVHRSLSSALLLGIMGEHTHNERARKILGRFIAVTSDIISNNDPSEISAPMERGITALRKLNIQEARTPRFVEDIARGSAGEDSSPNDDGSVRLDHSSIFTPSDTRGMDEDYSPYSVLNTILWGNSDTFRTGHSSSNVTS